MIHPSSPVLQKEPDIPMLKRLLMLKQFQIESLLDITNSINDNYSAHSLFRIYEFILKAQMGVYRLVVFHKDTKWSCVSCYGINTKCIGKIDIEEHLLPFNEITQLNEFDFSDKDDTLKEVLAPFDLLIPVYHKDEPLSFLLMGDIRVSTNDSLKEKVKFIQTISNIIIVAIENKRLFKQQIEQERFKKELEVASKVQTMLIPKSLPKNNRLEMHAVYKPHFNIGGDYYDYIPLNDDEFIVCMADVSGKGIGAALLMANVQAVLRAIARQAKSLKDLVLQLNDRIREITEGDKFITLFIAKHNLKTKTMTYINAGHNPPIMVINDNTSLLDKGCTILGILEKLPFIYETSLPISDNTLIITYTDGVTDLENSNGDFFEMDHLIPFVKEKAHLPVTVFNENLIGVIDTFKGEHVYTDDISILTYRIF